MATRNARGRATGRGDRGARDGARRRGDRRGAGPSATLPSVANHPRAGAQIKQAKAWGGLVGFGLVALLSWSGDVPFEDLVVRALAGGIIAYLVVWACAVALWRHLVLSELRVVRAQRTEEAAERAAAAASAAADDGDET